MITRQTSKMIAASGQHTAQHVEITVREAPGPVGNGTTNSDEDKPVRQTPIKREIPLNDIKTDAGTESRLVRVTVVGDYAELMRKKTIFPPVEVFEEHGEYYLADGFHRVAAARLANLQTIQAQVRHGGRLEALKAALGANEKHGVRRTSEDKRYAVDKALQEFPDWSDRYIAVMCHVSPTFVGQRRDQQQPTDNMDSSCGAEQPKRRGRDGKARRQPKKQSGSPVTSPVEGQKLVDSSETATNAVSVDIDEIRQMLSGLANQLDTRGQKEFWFEIANFAATKAEALDTTT